MYGQILSKFEIYKAVNCLKNGSPVIFPTETVYGLGASIFDEGGIQKIFSLKKRPADNPLIAHVASLEEAKRIAADLDDRFQILAQKFWPGPLAIVVKKKSLVPLIATAGHESIAIRMPANEIALQLIREVEEPLVAPSANISGRPSPTKLQDALEDFSDSVEFFIDGGECDIGIESTVISLLNSTAVILRPGKITKEELEVVLNCKIALPNRQGPILSPGMKYRHYAPKAKLELIFDKENLGYNYIEPSQKTFYQQLREIDRQRLETIQVYVSESVQNDVALMNRLLRAAGQIV